MASQQRRSQTSSVDFANLLTKWSEDKDPDNVVIAIWNKHKELKQFLGQDEINENCFVLLVKTLSSASRCSENETELIGILKILCESLFLTQHITLFTLSVHDLLGWQLCQEVVADIIQILQCILRHLPTFSYKVRVAASRLSFKIKEFDTLSDRDRIVNSLAAIVQQAITQHGSGENVSAQHNTLFQHKDTDTPSENFLEVPVIPTTSDLLNDSKPFLRKAVLKGGYKDAEHYLDVQFRLMRVDFMTPLKNGLKELRKKKEFNGFRCSDVRLYHNVKILQTVVTTGYNHYIQFDVARCKRVDWENTDRLMNGALVCLSKDGFKTIIVATVVMRKSEEIQLGVVEVAVQSGFEYLFESTVEDIYIMAESSTYYDPYFHVLESLKSMVEGFPLQSVLVRCESALRPPSYLLSRGDTINVPMYQLSSLMKDQQAVNVPLLTTTKWPNVDEMCLNTSQREAAILALTKEVAVIQGPPGTGKTYVGLKVVETLLINKKTQMAKKTTTFQSPILIVCYTNHALDQFLDGIYKFCPSGIARLGGGCKSENLKQFVIKIRQNITMSTEWQRVFLFLNKRLSSLGREIQSLGVLKDFMTKSHFEEFQEDAMQLSTWLNAPSGSPSEEIPKQIEKLFTQLALKWKYSMSKVKIKEEMDVLERCSIYCHVIKKIKEKVNTEKEFARRRDRQFLKAQEMQTLLNRLSSEIVSDNIIDEHYGKSFSQKVLEMLKSSQIDPPTNQAVKCWLLGKHKKLRSQLQEIQVLTRKLKNELPGSISQSSGASLKDYKGLGFYLSDEKCFASTIFDGSDDDLLSIVRQLDELNVGVMEESLASVSGGKISQDGWQNVSYLPKYSFAKVIREMARTSPMTEEEEEMADIKKLNLPKRYALYMLWVKRFRERLLETLLEKRKLCKEQQKEEMALNNKRLVSVLKSSHVIGMTTTGAAKNKDILEEVGCNIVIVEEAAEVLESHIVTALSKNCQHLILIGDHQQLRPKPATYELERNFGLDVSLFERLILNEIPHVTLKIQHRMRPEISQMIKLIYPELEDHPSVCQFEHIRGVSKDVFFINHNYHEVSDADSFSKSNEHEAKYVAALCEYFTKHVYSPSQITIITTYKGQVSLIRKYMKNPQPRVSAVDDFQGEENEIIILSLVRSNEENIAGFVKIDNRVCVALSRAKKGLFVIGNFNVLTSKSKLWKQIIDIAKKQSIFDRGLPVQCINHQDGNQVLKTAEDFLQRPEGGCGRPCKSLLECGHHCQLPCHGYDLKHESYVCERPCGRKCQLGHPCQMLCYEPCLCQHVLKKVLKECGHSIQLPCHKFLESSDCTEQCGKTLPCGHRCDGQCKCCMSQGSHDDCKVKVDYVVQSCGHKVQIPCFQSQSNVLCEVLRPAKLSCGHLQQIPCHVTPENAKCSEKCSKKLPCGHPCEGQCSDCVTNGSHKECQVLVDHIYSPCEHKGQVPCFQSSASVSCPHDCTSTLQCGHLCTGKCRDCVGKQNHKDCLTPVDYTYKQCGHSGQVPCYKSSSNVDCNQPCPSKLKCGHQCKGTCSGCLYGLVHKACQETCNQLLPCGHVCTGFCSSPCLPCTQPCSYSCRHSSCTTKSKQNFCGQPCPPCHAKCMQKCVHLVNLRYCSEPWENVVCTELCTKRLKVYHPGKHGSEGKTCSHPCGGFCGEMCVCSICEKVVCLENVDTTTLISTLNAKVAKSLNDDTKSSKGPIIKLPNCGHIFYAKELDKYVAKHNQVNASSYIYCPLCPKPILKCLRYDQLNWRRFQEREKRKLDLLQRNTISSEHESSIQRSISILTALKDFELYEEQLENVGNILSEEEFRSISLKIKFIYAISLIGLGHKECEEECRRASLLKFVLESARFTQQMEVELHEELVRCLRLNALKALEKFFSGKDFGDTRRSIEKIKSCLGKTPVEPDVLKMAHELIMALFDVPDERVKSLPAEYQQIRDKVLNIEKVLRSRTFETLADVLYPKKISFSKSNSSATHQDYFSKLFGNIEDPCAISEALTDAASKKEDDRPSDFRRRRNSIERNKTEKTKDETCSVKNETLRDRRSTSRPGSRMIPNDSQDRTLPQSRTSQNRTLNQGRRTMLLEDLVTLKRDQSETRRTESKEALVRPRSRLNPMRSISTDNSNRVRVSRERENVKLEHEDVAGVSMLPNQQTNESDPLNWRDTLMVYERDRSDRPNWRQLREIERQSWRHVREDSSDRKNWRNIREDSSDRKNWRNIREDSSDRKNWRKDAREDDSDRKNWTKDAREDDSDRKNWRKDVREDD
ncbi:NFX1-type zinc finger-containing protein 1-like isoform X2 [Biomphalaria glabrata]|uniref:NFX1-type zinc finger-containing protein 1-like n=1 Tax=Biomphalaria glabrata TaxID=6526 RepID=A0A9W3AUY4_BIOGL|nr:NFX1-type zinc finger-containing protein 1-like [Biomphalaria glabrata]KAI8762183.1 NFX1-type zinc finger-containing protein 1-like isoform X2 [Biomphalaria glabrata]